MIRTTETPSSSSISAVEALCTRLTGDQKSTLGACLKSLDPYVSTHPAFNEAFRKLYGWTSDAEGIRHSLMEDARLESEDVRFMLASCAAFINYLLAKACPSGRPNELGPHSSSRRSITPRTGRRPIAALRPRLGRSFKREQVTRPSAALGAAVGWGDGHDRSTEAARGKFGMRPCRVYRDV